MKYHKHLCVLLLTLLLAFGIAPSAAAETEIFDVQSNDSAMPVITRQPESLTVLCCEEFTLSVEAYIPNGDELGYQWYHGGSSIDGATGPTLTVPYFYKLYYYNFLYTFPGTRRASIHCRVYNKTGIGQVESEKVTVTMEACPEMPIITRQPSNTRTYFSGTVSMSVGAHIPSGSPIGYAWDSQSGNGSGSAWDRYTIVDGPTARITFQPHASLSQFGMCNFYCLVYNENDSEVYSGPHRAWSDEASVIHRWYGLVGTIAYYLLAPVRVLQFIFFWWL